MANVSVLDENGKIRLELETEGDRALIRPVGVIDEDVNFSVLLEFLAKMHPIVKSLRFDMGHVQRMNSCGVREWILLMERLPQGIPCSFVNVNELFVEQANMIPGMFGKRRGKVLSFHAPYHCGQCDTDVSVVLEPQEVQFEGGSPVAPPRRCKTCSAPLEFDWVEEEYFSFLGRLSVGGGEGGAAE